MARSEGFPPIARGDASILILGSLPGARSIAEQQYYAHPQNAFWKIMAELFGIEGDYVRRCQLLCEHGIALWDVLQSSIRPGSMDTAIRLDSAQPNDFESFFAEHPAIRTIGFNGARHSRCSGDSSETGRRVLLSCGCPRQARPTRRCHSQLSWVPGAMR